METEEEEGGEDRKDIRNTPTQAQNQLNFSA